MEWMTWSWDHPLWFYHSSTNGLQFTQSTKWCEIKWHTAWNTHLDIINWAYCHLWLLCTHIKTFLVDFHEDGLLETVKTSSVTAKFTGHTQFWQFWLWTFVDFSEYIVGTFIKFYICVQNLSAIILKCYLRYFLNKIMGYARKVVIYFIKLYYPQTLK